MKYIFQSPLTEDLLHNWKTSSLDIKVGFFFHFRGTAMQKSFEGVLRSLVIQVLQPHHTAFQKQHQKTWESFERLSQKCRTLKEQRVSVKYKLGVIMARKELISSERDLEEQLQRAMEDGGSEAKKKQTVRDIRQQLSQVRREKGDIRKWSTDLEEKEPELQLQVNRLQADIAVVSQSISSLAKKARPFRTQPETRFLRSIVAEFRNDSNPQIVRIERILSQLLDQNMVEIDLVLFFDALDEFDGHLDKMSGFLESLVERSTTSATRVKVCFSSRPWKSLNDHFAKYPGFRLQDHTKADIEQYATGSLTRLGVINFSEAVKIISSIIARANGVFLWVRLAMKELFDTVTESPRAELADRLGQKLLELPTDLFEFYKHIIERISETNRRYTFALLELLARHAGPPATATDIWGAVLTSSCATFQESLDALQSQSATTSNRNQQVTNDISAWGGGLVEIGARNHLQLMHQTVLEFTMDLLFKRIVVGDVAAILNENGHSFYFKYWLATTGLGRHQTANNTELWAIAANPRPSYVEELKERKLAAYHAEKSESTTGISQLDFINSVPIPDLQRLFQTATTPIYESNAVFLTFASSYGLTLCIRDWIARNPGELRRISLQRGQPPLLTCLAFEPVGGVFHEGLLTTARLLLENGYSIAKETQFFPHVLEKVYNAEAEAFMNESDAQAAIVPAIHKLAALVLDHCQDPNIFSTMSSLDISILLHMAPPGLAAELIRRTANVNRPDSMARTPLDWALTPPRWCLHWSLARRYEMCCLLVNAGGLMSPSTPAKAWTDALAEFDNAGYDTQILWSKDPSQRHNFKTPLRATCPPPTCTQPPAASAPFIVLSRDDLQAQNSKQRHRSPRSFFLDLLKKT